MGNRFYYVVIGSLITYSSLFSQNNTWQKLFSGTLFNFGLENTSDSGFIMVGAVLPDTTGGTAGNGAYIQKLNKYGNADWVKKYRDLTGRAITTYAIKQTPDNGYIIGGGSPTYNPSPQNDITAIRVDINGNVLWSKFYASASGNEYIFSICSLNSGEYIMCGSVTPLGSFPDGLIIKLNSLGDTIWSKTYGGSSIDYINQVIETSDGGLMAVGTHNNLDIMAIKMDNNGNIEWINSYGGGSEEKGLCVQQTADNGYIIAGHTSSFGAGQKDIYLLKLSSNGTIVEWSKTYGGVNDEWNIHGFQKLPDGGYALLGNTKSFGFGDLDVLLVRTDSNGNVLWSKVYGGSDIENGFQTKDALRSTYDDGFIFLTDKSYSFTPTGSAYLIKADKNGVSGCHEKDASIIVSNATTIVTTLTYTATPFHPSINSYNVEASSTCLPETILCPDEFTAFPNPISACDYPDTLVTLIANLGATSYFWSTNETKDTIYSTPPATTSFAVTAYHGACTNPEIKSMTITVIPAPSIELSVSPGTSICEGISIVLTGTGAESYQWISSSEGIMNDTDSTILITPASTTTYSMTATACSGDTATYTTTIYIQDCTTTAVYLPNSFTPDNNGINDTFIAASYGEVKNYSLKIYDRWGGLLFETTDIKTGWNGLYQNIMAPQDIYAYQLNYKFENSDEVQQVGSLLLIH